MKFVFSFLVVVSIALAGFAQTTARKGAPESTPKKASSTARSQSPPNSNKASARPTPPPNDPDTEKKRFEAAIAAATATERVSALEKFIQEYPESKHMDRALHSLFVSRISFADEKFKSGETGAGVILLKQAVTDLQTPVGGSIFDDVVSKVPMGVFYQGQRAAAFEIAGLIEKKIAGNADQLLSLANFHLSFENGDDAKRIALAAAAVKPDSAAAFQMIGFAERLNFQLEDAAASFAKALEVDPESASAKRSLAEMKRALGKPDEAAALYREILARDETDVPSQTGLILSLFESGKSSEAQAAMARSLEQTPSNVILLGNAAYWYASAADAENAADLARKAIALDPRYVWSHIALARAYILQKKPADAERVLLAARRYGNFPTLEYEIASARMISGFYREAAESLTKSFEIRDGQIRAKLGGRIERSGASFSELIASERKASIFAPLAPEQPETDDRLRSLLEFSQELAAEKPDETSLMSAADRFTAGADGMKLHRQLYTASQLLEKNIALGKVLELTKAAMPNTEAALDVQSSSSAVMASELYESRAAASIRNEYIAVPDVPRQTLSAIIRGRIEELSGWALYNQGNFPAAVTRLRRAISVLPEKSAWWRSSKWRLGSALQAENKDAEALENYIQGYNIEKPELIKYVVVEALYRKVNGSLDGLEAKIGPNPLPPSDAKQIAAADVKVASAVAEPSPQPLETAPAQQGDAKTAVETAHEPKSEASPKPATDASVESPHTANLEKPDPKPAGTEMKETDPSEQDTKADQTPSDETGSDPPKTEGPVKTEKLIAIQKELESQPEIDKLPPAARLSDLPAGNSPDEANGSTVTHKTEKPDLVTEKKVVANPLFEPVVITIPVPGKASVKNVVPAADGEKMAESASEVKQNEKSEKTGGESSESEGKSGDEHKARDPLRNESLTNAVDARPRLVDGKEITEDIPLCTINVSQENVSLVNRTGSIGILAGIDGDDDVKKLKAISNSPGDVEVIVEPEIAGVTGRAFFVLRSISSNTGMYQVAFIAPCGKRNVLVSVR
jgi:tetratricopeptide (TPR) repeat protein